MLRFQPDVSTDCFWSRTTGGRVTNAWFDQRRSSTNRQLGAYTTARAILRELSFLYNASLLGRPSRAPCGFAPQYVPQKSFIS
jgi:hypothetical protein